MFNKYVVVWSFTDYELVIYLSSEAIDKKGRFIANSKPVYFYNEKGFLNWNKDEMFVDDMNGWQASDEFFREIEESFYMVYGGDLYFNRLKPNASVQLKLSTTLSLVCVENSLLLSDSDLSALDVTFSQFTDHWFELTDGYKSNFSKLLKLSDVFKSNVTVH